MGDVFNTYKNMSHVSATQHNYYPSLMPYQLNHMAIWGIITMMTSLQSEEINTDPNLSSYNHIRHPLAKHHLKPRKTICEIYSPFNMRFYNQLY